MTQSGRTFVQTCMMRPLEQPAFLHDEAAFRLGHLIQDDSGWAVQTLSHIG